MSAVRRWRAERTLGVACGTWMVVEGSGTWVAAAMVVAQLSGRWVTGRTTATRQANAALTSAIQELVGGIRVLRMFGRSQATVDRVRTLSEQAETHLRSADQKAWHSRLDVEHDNLRIALTHAGTKSGHASATHWLDREKLGWRLGVER